MYIINTSFHVDCSHFDTLVSFIKSTLIPSQIKSNSLREPLLLEILVEVDPELRSLSLQFHTDDINAGMEAIEASAPLMADITKQCGGAEHLLSFTTPMAVI